MPSFVSGTFVIPSNAPYGSYTFNASGGGLSISKPSAVKIYNNYITPDSGLVNTAIPFTIYVNTAGLSYYYSTNINGCYPIQFRQSNGSWERNVYPNNPDPSNVEDSFEITSPFTLTGTFPAILEYPHTLDVYVFGELLSGSPNWFKLDSQFILTV